VSSACWKNRAPRQNASIYYYYYFPFHPTSPEGVDGRPRCGFGISRGSLISFFQEFFFQSRKLFKQFLKKNFRTKISWSADKGAISTVFKSRKYFEEKKKVKKKLSKQHLESSLTSKGALQFVQRKLRFFSSIMWP